MQRDAYVDVEAVLEEVAAFLATHPAPGSLPCIRDSES
jgi:hypothetical protein